MKTIQCIQEIVEPNIQYEIKGVIIEIQLNRENEYNIGICKNGRHDWFVGSGWNTIKAWKTLNGAKKALEKGVQEGYYGLSVLQ